MGYDTEFNLTYKAPLETEAAIDLYVKHHYNMHYALNEGQCKWYDHEEDMKELSRWG